MRKKISFFVIAVCSFTVASAQQKFNGINTGMGNLWQLSNAKTRSISAENFSGAKGQGGMATNGTGANAAKGLGQGWKISPSVVI
ncbi:MAG TPA: hypothetical protein PL045_13145, partial [Chitinophagaceae bacterium]|nr:hypothetical protein [Chitinophagaceae bacterium]